MISTLPELLSALHTLNRKEKLQVMQLLVAELTADENLLVTSETSYEVWSPYDAPGAAEKMLAMLAADQQAGDS